MPHIRPATPDDEAFLLGLTAQLAAFPIPPWRTADEIARGDHAMLLGALREATADMAILLIEEPRGAPAGYTFISTHYDFFTGIPHAHVEILAVEPAARGLGLARLLMEGAEQWARARGHDRVTLNVFFANQVARDVYHHLGYVPETVHYFKQL